MNETGALTEIKACLLDFNPDPHSPSSTDIYKEKSRELRAIVEEKEMPRELEETIQTYYRELSSLQSNHSAPVAVRSAGAVSHPGQYETYLQVVGASDLSEKVKRVWSSTFNTRSLIARHRSGFPLESSPIGVGVITMVDARAAGVMFTVNPANGDPSRISIEANWGLGESVVSGAVTPDKWMVDKVTLKIVQEVVSNKHLQFAIDPETKQPSLLDVPMAKQSAPCLEEEEVMELVRTGKEIERHFGEAQDIEWAVDDTQPLPRSITVLQTRPVQGPVAGKGKRAYAAGTTGLDLIMEIAIRGKL
jgi:pyruvate,water dikinase